MIQIVIFFSLICVFHSITNAEPHWRMYGGDPSHTSYKPDILGPNISPQRKWNVTICPSSLTRCVVSNGVVYVNCQTGNLFVLDPLTGQPTKSIFFGGGSGVGPPNINRDETHVYVEVNGGNQGLYVCSLDLNLGTISWTNQGTSLFSSYDFGMVENSELLFFNGGQYDGIVYAASLSTGKMKFASVTTGNCDNLTPTLFQGRLFWNSCTRFGEMSISDGAVLWWVDLRSSGTTYAADWVPSISSKGFAYAISKTNLPSPTVNVVQIDLTFKRTTWGYPCSVRYGSVSAMAVDDDAGLGWIACIDAVKGIDLTIGFEKISFPCSDCSDQPVVTKDYVIARSATGTMVWEKATGDLVTKLPASGYLAYEKGWLYVVSGRSLAAYELSQRVVNG